jgi:Spy/CpxP family protein refolding chaperone
MKTRLSVTAAALTLLGLFSGNAFAAKAGCCGGGGPAIFNELSPEQRQQALSLRTDLMKKQEAIRSEIAQKRIELMEKASQGKPDEQTIEKKRQEIWALQDNMRNERRAMGTKFRAILTPEQRQKLGPMGFGSGFGSGGRGGCGFGGGGCGGCGKGSSSL